jgi:hypothetical protein
METLKRILAGAVIVLCILGILVAALGVVAVWRINTPVTESLTKLLTSVDAILQIVETGLVSFNVILGDGIDLVQSVENTIVETGETVKETNLLLVLIDATIGDELIPLLEKASTTLNSVVESVVAVNDTLEAINSVPFISIPTLTADLEAAEVRIVEIQNDVDETQQEVQAAKEEAVDSVVSPVSTRLKQVDSDLQFVGEQSTQFESQVTASREGIGDVIEKLPGWIDLASVTMTLVMAWLIFAQGSLLLLSYAYIRTREFKITLGDGEADDDIEKETQGEDEAGDA